MKKRVFTAALLTAMVLQSIPAFAAEYEATAYDVPYLLMKSSAALNLT